MESVIIVGSGPASAGCVAGLLENGGNTITVLDIGAGLPDATREIARRIREVTPDKWPHDLRLALYPTSHQAANSSLPEKLVLGSDYPFVDHGQMTDITWTDGEHPNVISGAMGGFSNVWGGQAYPFSSWALRNWPERGRKMPGAYTAIRRLLPIAGLEDSLLEFLPSYGLLSELPPLAIRTQRILKAFSRRREELAGLGIHAGAARVAIDVQRCIKCGLCNGGCAWDLIFSSRQLFKRWIAEKKITYVPEIVVKSVKETASGVEVHTISLNRERRSFTADRVFLAAGAVGTSKIVLNSFPELNDLEMKECRQMIVPLVFPRSARTPEEGDTFALGQAGIYFAPLTSHEAFLQLYPYDPSFVSGLPRIVRQHPALRNTLLRHLAIGLLYFNSEQSPTIRLRAVKTSSNEVGIELSGKMFSKGESSVRETFSRLGAAGKHAGFRPVIPLTKVTPAGRSYHWGGQFGYEENPKSQTSSDRLGRLSAWHNIHIVDASTFPTLGPTGFLLTVMANAYRIARETAYEEAPSD